jgi:hypothetical protein
MLVTSYFNSIDQAKTVQQTPPVTTHKSTSKPLLGVKLDEYAMLYLRRKIVHNAFMLFIENGLHLL